MKALIVGTGPSLADAIPIIPKIPGRLFVLNNCWSEPWVKEHYDNHGIPACWIACDENWHYHYGPQDLPEWIEGWHWDADIAKAGNYRFIEGVWHKGLWLKDKTAISLNHGSAPQLINLAAHYGCNPLLLLGHDFTDTGKRHYFNNLSPDVGEYPVEIRKHSLLCKPDGQYDMREVYRELGETAKSAGIEIYNCTPGSKLPWFPRRNLDDYTEDAGLDALVNAIP